MFRQSLQTRRSFLADVGMGFTGLALGATLFKDGVARGADPLQGPHFPAKAKNVIWLFMVGGTSQGESFDPKPELNKHAGKTIAESPYKAALDSPHLKKNLREFVPGLHKVHPKIYPMQVTHKKYGKAGIEVSDWWPHVGACIDDIAVVRSMWTTDNDHGAQLSSIPGDMPSKGRSRPSARGFITGSARLTKTSRGSWSSGRRWPTAVAE